MEGKLLGFDYDLLVTMIGLLVAGMAAIIGIWVERDPKRPPRYAIWLSVLISLATGVSMFQTYDDDQDQKKVEGDLARVLQQLDKIATDSDVEIPELNALIKSELAAQSRANPNVVDEFAQRVSDEGDDPSEVVAAYLPSSEVEKIQRKGTLAPKPRSKPLEAPPAESTVATRSEGGPPAPPTQVDRKERRKRLSFSGAPRLNAPPAKPEPKPEEPKKEEPKNEPVEAPPADPKAPATVKEPLAPREGVRVTLPGAASARPVAKPPVLTPRATPGGNAPKVFQPRH